MIINEIHSRAIILYEDSLRTGELIQSKGFTGFVGNSLALKKYLSLQLSPQKDNEKYLIVLNYYENMLSEFSDKPTKEEAICIANIIKICYRYLRYTNFKRYCELGERVELIVSHLNIDTNEKWYKDFLVNYHDVKNLSQNYYYIHMSEMIKKKYKKKFEEIEDEFYKRKNTVDFINYILKLRPYDGYEEDVRSGKEVNVDTQDNLYYLMCKYHPCEYTFKAEDEETLLDYLIIEYIHVYLNKLHSNL